jgi:hypothetical protein
MHKRLILSAVCARMNISVPSVQQAHKRGQIEYGADMGQIRPSGGTRAKGQRGRGRDGGKEREQGVSREGAGRVRTGD